MSTAVSIEIIPERMFFNVLSSQPSNGTTSAHHVHTQDIFDILYVPFAFDFGPPNVGQIYRFVKMMNKLLALNATKKVIYYSLIAEAENTTNAICLMGGFCIFSLAWTASKVEERFSALKAFSKFYRDASQGPSTYDLDVFTCFVAMEKAKNLRWIDFDNFNLTEYQYYEQVENGDFNWIIPGKFIAMCTPTQTARRTETTVTHTPQYYIPYFKKHNVNSVIRLNTVEYDRNTFLQAGIDHHDMYFIDGTVPTLEIVEKFLKVVETANGAIAVHCKQGLGRTGSLIACYIMKFYDFSPPEVIAFLRLQRPGSVVGPQQHFLHKIEPSMKAAKKCCDEPISPVAHRNILTSWLSPSVISFKKTHPRSTPVKA